MSFALASAATSTDRYTATPLPRAPAACDVVVTDGISMLVEGQVYGPTSHLPGA
jgi:hypothetical protein